jgi:hypothetical protein
MTTAERAVVVTVADRGIGQALVGQAPTRSEKRVCARTRHPFTFRDGRVTLLILDVGIFPDPMSESVAQGWRTGAAKALERLNGWPVAAEPAPS